VGLDSWLDGALAVVGVVIGLMLSEYLPVVRADAVLINSAGGCCDGDELTSRLGVDVP
jgi:hypothetical protein